MIWPFDASTVVEPNKVDLTNVTVEQFTITRGHARPLAQDALEALEAGAVAREIPGRLRNVHVNVLMEGATSRAALAPIFVMAYRYKGRVYRFLLNGQSGRSTGSAPISKAKVSLAVAGAVVMFVLLILLLMAR